MPQQYSYDLGRFSVSLVQFFVDKAVFMVAMLMIKLYNLSRTVSTGGVVIECIVVDHVVQPFH